MKYIALLDYQSTLGEFAAGDIVELSESVARAINRDQPRTLTLSIEQQGEGNEDNNEAANEAANEAGAEAGAEAGTEDVETRAMPTPPQDRMVRRAPRNRAK